MCTSSNSRFTLNDTYRTDVPLLYPPYIVALAALYIAFTLTAMSSSSARTRSSSQMNTLAASIDTNAALQLPPPPGGTAEFLASFQVSLPALFACVQDMICLYPIWEAFEPSPQRNNAAQAAPPPNPDGGKFGPEDAEALVRKMIEEHMIDVGHPDDAGRPIKGLPGK
jgi:cyclin C